MSGIILSWCFKRNESFFLISDLFLFKRSITVEKLAEGNTLRYILEIESNKLRRTEKILTENKIFFENIGFTQKDYFEIDGEFKTSVKDLFKVNNEWYNKY